MSYRSAALPRLCLAVAALVAAVPASAAPVNFTAQLFGQAEVPPVQSEQYGSCIGVLSEDESQLTLSCEHTLDAATGAHIHAGFAGQSGPVAFDLGAADSPIQATWSLDGDDVVRLLAGGFYVNVHTDDHPDGAIRGQLVASQPTAGHVLRFPLQGSQEVPPVSTAASGACWVNAEFDVVPFLPVQKVTLHLRCTHSVPDVIGAELVIGAPGETGTTTFDLGTGVSPIDKTVVLDSASEAQAFEDRELYVNIRSASDSGGELRGQLAGCLEDANTLCLNDNRFQASMTWNLDTDTGDATGRKETLDSGLFWFFRPSNIEALVKVLDGCGVNDHYWVFLAATTNVGYQLRVTDTETGDLMTYTNVRGHDAVPKLDTAAFATCP